MRSWMRTWEESCKNDGYNPTGRLPIQMPKDMDAVEEQSEDRALDMETYIDSEGHNYDYGYGMNYEGVLPAWKK